MRSKWSKSLKTTTPGHGSHSVNIGWFFFTFYFNLTKTYYSTCLAVYLWYSAKARRLAAAKRAVKRDFLSVTEFWMCFLGCWCVHTKRQICLPVSLQNIQSEEKGRVVMWSELTVRPDHSSSAGLLWSRENVGISENMSFCWFKPGEWVSHTVSASWSRWIQLPLKEIKLSSFPQDILEQ